MKMPVKGLCGKESRMFDSGPWFTYKSNINSIPLPVRSDKFLMSQKGIYDLLNSNSTSM